MKVHCWVREEPAPAFSHWDPDVEPGLYPSGVGHGVLELARRLQARGHSVTIGRSGAEGRALLLHLESLWDWSRQRADRRALADALAAMCKASTVTVVRGDIPLSFSPHLPGAIEVMPNKASIRRRSQVWLPLLPQRGLVPRTRGRYGRVRSVGILAFDLNVPEYFRSADFRARTSALGIDLISRTWDAVSADVPDWHDLSTIDAVLCLAKDALGTGLLRKPPTKLINTWNAGAIPIVSTAQPAYVELARPNIDALFATTPEDVPAILECFADLDFVSSLERGGRERALEFSMERVLNSWEEMLSRPAPKTALALPAVRMRARAVDVYGRAVRRALGPATRLYAREENKNLARADTPNHKQ